MATHLTETTYVERSLLWLKVWGEEFITVGEACWAAVKMNVLGLLTLWITRKQRDQDGVRVDITLKAIQQGPSPAG